MAMIAHLIAMNNHHINYLSKQDYIDKDNLLTILQNLNDISELLSKEKEQNK